LALKRLTQEIELVARKGTLALLGFSEQEIDGLGDLSKYSLQELKRISDEKKYSDLTQGQVNAEADPVERDKTGDS
jgi:hypothetical protein